MGNWYWRRSERVFSKEENKEKSSRVNSDWGKTRDEEPFLQTRFRRGNFSTESIEKNGQFVIVRVGGGVREGEAEERIESISKPITVNSLECRGQILDEFSCEQREEKRWSPSLSRKPIAFTDPSLSIAHIDDKKSEGWTPERKDSIDSENSITSTFETNHSQKSKWSMMWGISRTLGTRNYLADDIRPQKEAISPLFFSRRTRNLHVWKKRRFKLDNEIQEKENCGRERERDDHWHRREEGEGSHHSHDWKGERTSSSVYISQLETIRKGEGFRNRFDQQSKSSKKGCISYFPPLPLHLSPLSLPLLEGMRKHTDLHAAFSWRDRATMTRDKSDKSDGETIRVIEISLDSKRDGGDHSLSLKNPGFGREHLRTNLVMDNKGTDERTMEISIDIRTFHTSKHKEERVRRLKRGAEIRSLAH